jgi:hypothetical protein
MDKLQFDRADYSVVVKNRAPPPKAWRWEIYRAGNASSIRQSPIYFDTVMAARRAEKRRSRSSWTSFFPDRTGVRAPSFHVEEIERSIALFRRMILSAKFATSATFRDHALGAARTIVPTALAKRSLRTYILR